MAQGRRRRIRIWVKGEINLETILRNYDNFLFLEILTLIFVFQHNIQ